MIWRSRVLIRPSHRISNNDARCWQLSVCKLILDTIGQKGAESGLVLRQSITGHTCSRRNFAAPPRVIKGVFLEEPSRLNSC